MEATLDEQAAGLATDLDQWLARRAGEAPSLDAGTAEHWEVAAEAYLDYVDTARAEYISLFEPQVRRIVAALREAGRTAPADLLAQIYENPPGFPAIGQIVTGLRGVVITPPPASVRAQAVDPTVIIGDPKPK